MISSRRGNTRLIAAWGWLLALPAVFLGTHSVQADRIMWTRATIHDAGLFENIDQLPGLFLSRYKDRPEFDESFFQVKT